MYPKRLSLLITGVLLAVVCITGALYAGGEWNILQQQDQEIRDYFAITFTSRKNGWVVGESILEPEDTGFIGQTRDGGKTWEKVEVSIKQRLSDVYFFDDKNGWAVGDGGTIVGTTDGGKRWDLQVSKVDNWLRGVHFISPKIGYAAGNGETILQTKNGGKTWKVLLGGEIGAGVGDEDTSAFNGAYFIDESTGWVTGVRISPSAGTQDALIKKTIDGGATWVDQPTNIEDILKDIIFVDASTGWAVGENGVVLHTTDGGDTWQLQSSGTEEKLESVYFADKDAGWAVGGDMGINIILHTTDGGNTWESQSASDSMISKQPAYDVFALDADDVWITGPNGMVLKYAK